MARKTYTKEFKLEAAKLVVEQGMKASVVGKDLGVSVYLLNKWVRQYREEGAGSFPGQGRLLPRDEELRKLQKELHQTRMERDILKKAIAYFAKHEE
jgi:transposase